MRNRDTCGDGGSRSALALLTPPGRSGQVRRMDLQLQPVWLGEGRSKRLDGPLERMARAHYGTPQSAHVMASACNVPRLTWNQKSGRMSSMPPETSAAFTVRWPHEVHGAILYLDEGRRMDWISPMETPCRVADTLRSSTKSSNRRSSSRSDWKCSPICMAYVKFCMSDPNV